VAPVEAAAVEVAVNMPSTLAALVALELAQVAAPGRAAVVQGAPVAVERLGDDRCVVAVGIGKAGDGEEDEEGHEKEVAGGAGGGHSWGEGREGDMRGRMCVPDGVACALSRMGADNFQ
jgi:hypothetical protein